MGTKMGSLVIENGWDLCRLDCPSSHCCLQEEFHMVNQKEMQPSDPVGCSCWDILRLMTKESKWTREWVGVEVENTACFFEAEKNVKPSKFQLRSHENHSDSAGKVLIWRSISELETLKLCIWLSPFKKKTPSFCVGLLSSNN